MNFIIVKQFGYQTICPDEENTTGYYEVDGYDSCKSVYGWKRPSLSSEKHEISHIVSGNSIWGWGDKHNNRDGYDWVKVSKRPVYWMPKKVFNY
jgi:hypothetical protein